MLIEWPGECPALSLSAPESSSEIVGPKKRPRSLGYVPFPRRMGFEVACVPFRGLSCGIEPTPRQAIDRAGIEVSTTHRAASQPADSKRDLAIEEWIPGLRRRLTEREHATPPLLSYNLKRGVLGDVAEE